MDSKSVEIKFPEGMSDVDKIRYLWSVISHIREKTTEDLSQVST